MVKILITFTCDSCEKKFTLNEISQYEQSQYTNNGGIGSIFGSRCPFCKSPAYYVSQSTLKRV